MSIGHIVGLLRSFASFVINTVTLNPSDKSSLVSLFNGNMTAMKNISGSAWRSVRANQPRIFGKYYFEIVFNTFTGSSGCSGLMNASSNIDNFAGSDTNGISWFTDGSWFTGNSATFGSLPTSWANGDVLCVAVDFDNKRLWARKNNGTWNATSGGSNDPVTNVGGLTLPTSMQGVLLYPAVSVQTATDQSTARFTLSSFDYTVPSGFSAWESAGQVYVTQQRAYAIAGSLKDGLAVNQHKAHAIVGMPRSGQLTVHSQRAYVILRP